MDPYYTSTGSRPDLAALPVNPPEEYIGQKIIPVANVMEKSGVVYYRTVTADVAAQTNRSSLAAPSGTAITNSNTTFTCAERIKRGEIAPDEAKAMGGIARADKIGATFAKRSVMNSRETAVATLTVGATKDATFDPAKFQAQAQTGLDTVRRYYGKTTLFGATITLKRMVMALVQDGAVGKVFSNLVTGTSPGVAVQGLNFQAWLNAIALWAGVDQVLAGDDAIWNAGANAGKFCIAKLDDGTEELVHKYEPVYAREFMFLPDGTNPWYMETIGDINVKSNKYDASVWDNFVELNADAVYVFGGVPS